MQSGIDNLMYFFKGKLKKSFFCFVATKRHLADVGNK